MTKTKIVLEEKEKQELNRRLRTSAVSVRDRQRAQIILLAAEGYTLEVIGARVGMTRVTMSHWCQRFIKERLAGLMDAPGRGRKPSLPDTEIKKVLETVTRPPDNLGRWNCRTMARAAGTSRASVQRLWAANDIKPHLTRTFKMPNDAHLEEKFWDVIGLYLNPPEKALVLCCDEKSQCQALERTQPGLPLGIGHIKDHNARLYSPWHFNFVCCAKLSGGKTDHDHRGTTPASGMAGIPQEDRTGNTERPGCPPDCRQLRNPQASRGKSLAGQAPRIPHALHANFVLMA